MSRALSGAIAVVVVGCHGAPPTGASGAEAVPIEKRTLYCTTEERRDLQYVPDDGFHVTTPLDAPVGGCLAKLVQAGLFRETGKHRSCATRQGALSECISLVDVHVYEPTFDGAKVRARTRAEDGVLSSGGPAIPCYEAESIQAGLVKYRPTDLGTRVLAACDPVWVVDGRGARALKPPSDELALASSPDGGVPLYDLGAPASLDAGVSLDAQGEFASRSLRSLFQAITASSFIDDKAERHPPEYAFDGDPATAWSESAPGPGKGEWVQVEFERPVEIEAVEMTTGFDRVTDLGEDLFVLNPRFKRVRIETSEGDPYEQDVPEGQRKLRVELGLRRTTRLRIVAADVVPGKKWQDLSLSEATVLGRAAK